MDERDLDIRRRTYERFVEFGRAPGAGELGLPREDVEASWKRLHEAHALVLESARPVLRMANPFSAVPTAYRVEAGGRRWYANCAWDAFGICAALGVDGVIQASCPDCGDDIVIEVRGERPEPDVHLFHCLLPASRWWDDIVFT